MAQRKLDVVLDSVRRLIRLGATANLVNLLLSRTAEQAAERLKEDLSP